MPYLPPVFQIDDGVESAAPLPAHLTRLIGREQELTALGQFLSQEDVRLLTLVGPGGVGKTRLALGVAAEAGESFDDVTFVDCSTLTDPVLVLPVIARTLGVLENGTLPLLDRLGAVVGSRRLLLVLDNLEQVAESGPDLALLLRACRGVTILATSRVPLRVSGEHQFPVAPLGAKAALTLFVERARAVRREFALTEANEATIAAVCQELDGLPLAIELAAARSKVLSPQALLARLPHGLALLTGGARDLPARLQTMRDAITWSYDLLAESERTLFRQLSVFAGGFTLEAAEVVGGQEDGGAKDSRRPVPSSPSVLDGITSLVDGSLVRQREGPDGESRLDLLVTIREYGLEQLAAAGELASTRQRHADWCLDLAEAAWPAFARRADQEPWLDRLEIEHDNIRAALGWLDATDRSESVLRLSGRLYWFWYVRGYLNEGRDWLERAIARATDAPTEERARALLGLAILAHWQGDDARAIPCLEACLALWQELKDDWGIIVSLVMRGIVAEDTGDFPRAVPFLEQALTNARAAGDRPNAALALDHLGVVAWGQGNTEDAMRSWQDALLMHRETGDSWGASISLSYLGMVASERGEFERSDALLRESLQQRWEIGTKEDIAHGLANFGALAAAGGQARRAARLFGAAEAIQEAIGNELKEPERSFYARAIARTRASLSDADFAAAWAAGRVLSSGEAVTEALATPAPPPATTVPAGRSQPIKTGGLSARELEVLTLLVAGKTDRQIAETLFISPRTAQVHVANILSKLRVTSRAAAAAYAIREHLVAPDL